ncbi:hypothetical protein SAMN05216559_1884 [Halomicrobium zhouii]|uniref:Uncharacterized protein n=2 Tax=Halomicrobium zhouii TaxID=767519 RepID=A0A1I6L280_9EURY|nr:hypothetical protein SAMN05216559_1884 [Halomicrobium zhouii]
MAKAEEVTIDTGTSSLTIKDLEIEDADVVDFLSDRSPPEREESVRRAIQVGVTAMKLMDTTQDIEFVERRLSDLEGNLEDGVDEFREELEAKVGDDGELEAVLQEHIGEDGKLIDHFEEAFGEEGPLKERLDEEFGEDGEKIRAALDPDVEGTPTNRLLTTIERKFESLHEKLGEEEKREEIRSETYYKGEDFEATVENILDDMVRQTNATVEFTGDTEGAMEGRDVGDFVIELGETDQRIAIEAKTTYQSTSGIKDEMADVIPNREADYGIYVVDQLDNIPEKKVGWFEEIDNDFVVIALSEGDEDEPEPGYLRIAYNWARLRALQSHADIGEEFDAERLQSELDEIEESVGRFSTIKGHCTEIEKSRNKIEQELSEIERDIKERLGEISAELHKVGSD